MNGPLSVGTALAPFVVEAVSPQAMRDWAGFLHDPNPIHLDADVVRAKGLGDRVINQGPANVAYLINMLHRAIPGGTIAALESRFLDNVYAGERVTAAGTVTAIDGDRVAVSLSLDADGRGAVLSGSAIIVLTIPTHP